MQLFSDFVAADAESSNPVMKKEDPMDKPLHFKYYQNEGEDENSLTENLTDDILGRASNEINKKTPKLKYDHSDPGWGVTPTQPVDYSKATKDKSLLYEPLENVPLEDVPEELERLRQEEISRSKNEETIELTTS